MTGSKVTTENLPPILPVGTAVVSRVQIKGKDGVPVHPKGAAGVIVKSPADPDHRYQVRFAGGDETSLRRRDLYVLKHYQQAGFDPKSGQLDPMIEHDLWQYVIYRAVVGSRAYGLSHNASDVDRRGVYLPPAEMHWSLYGIPDQLENPDTEECYWELEKFLKLGLKANPNVLEVLYTPLVERSTELADQMLAIRPAFLSKLIYQTFNGYAMSQFKKLEQDVRNHGQIKWKHAMHLVRLLLAGMTALREGHVPVRVEDGQRDRLLAIRDGQMGWQEVNAWRLDLHKQFQAAFATTKLPDRPDYDAVNAFLIKARRSALDLTPKTR